MTKNEPSNLDGEQGVIINVSSICSTDRSTCTPAYGASKGTIAGMAAPLARELGSNGIRVVSVALGKILFQMSYTDHNLKADRLVYLHSALYSSRYLRRVRGSAPGSSII